MAGSSVSTPAVQASAPIRTYTYAAPVYSAPVYTQPYLPYNSTLLEQQKLATQTQATSTLTAATQQYTAQKSLLQMQKEQELRSVEASLTLRQMEQLQQLELSFAQRKAEIEAARMAESANIDHTALALSAQAEQQKLEQDMAKASGMLVAPVVTTMSAAAVEAAKTRSAGLLKLQADAALKQAHNHYTLQKQLITGEIQRALDATKQSLEHARSVQELEMSQQYELQKAAMEQSQKQQALELDAAAQSMKTQMELAKMQMEAQKQAALGGLSLFSAPTYAAAPQVVVSTA